jgi:hypothetical protein
MFPTAVLQSKRSDPSLERIRLGPSDRGYPPIVPITMAWATNPPFRFHGASIACGRLLLAGNGAGVVQRFSF